MANKVDLAKIVPDYKTYLSKLGDEVLKKNKPNMTDFTKIYYVANTLLGMLEIFLTIEENKANLEAYIAGLRIGEKDDDIRTEDDEGE